MEIRAGDPERKAGEVPEGHRYRDEAGLLSGPAPLRAAGS
jgi:hypothetical protein